MANKARKLFILAGLISMIFIMGYISARKRIFPFNKIDTVLNALKELTTPKWYYFDTTDSIEIKINMTEALDWPLLISSIGDNDSLIVKIIENDGNLIHKWNIEWFNIWGDADHLPDDLTPKERPGTHIHGIHLFEDGSIVFNFEQRGLVRLDMDGKPMWKLPMVTDHSVHFDGSILWVCAQKHHSKSLPNYPGYVPPFIEPLILKVSKDGEILEQTSVFELLRQNKLEGLIYNPSIANMSVQFSGSVIHLNDVEPFSIEMQEGFFKHGDVMLSFRNSNSILIYNDSTKMIKDVVIGGFVRQHDPDFIDGNQISIYDNYNISSSDPSQQSRILIKSYTNQEITTYYNGNTLTPFNSIAMGKHQWLVNGNLLITSPLQGRAFEINAEKEIVWEYLNVVENNKLGLLDEVSRINPDKLKAFIKK
jgi:hypothetical protein